MNHKQKISVGLRIFGIFVFAAISIFNLTSYANYYDPFHCLIGIATLGGILFLVVPPKNQVARKTIVTLTVIALLITAVLMLIAFLLIFFIMGIFFEWFFDDFLA